MTEFPLLCQSGHCRPDEHGGPRRTMGPQAAWWCDVCADHVRENLRSIASSWGDLEDMLGAGDGGHVEQGRQKRGAKAAGLVLNEQASAARSKASEVVWFMARALLDWHDEHDRTLHVPDDQSIPGLARWLATWHVDHFAGKVGRYIALAVADDVHQAQRAVWNAAYPKGGRRIETGLRCIEKGTSDQGEPIPCEGVMTAYVWPLMPMEPDLVCSEDRDHRIVPADYRRAGWVRRAMPANEDATRNLVRILARAEGT